MMEEPRDPEEPFSFTTLACVWVLEVGEAGGSASMHKKKKRGEKKETEKQNKTGQPL